MANFYKTIAFVLFILLVFKVNSQTINSNTCSHLKQVRIQASVLGCPFNKAIILKKNIAHNIIQLVTSDTSYRIIGFNVYLVKQKGEAEFFIHGNSLSFSNLPAIKSLKNGDRLSIECIIIKKDNDYFSASPFMISIE